VLNDSIGIDTGWVHSPVDLRISTRANMRKALEAMFYNKSMVSDDLVDMAYSLHLERGDGPTIRSVLETIRAADEKLDSSIGGMKAPTLLLRGEQDALAPLAMARTFQQLISGSCLDAIPECGHFPCLEKPAEFARRVLQFLP
jgi:pimeloyl-ACP methyl ester carboxylesterase